MGEREETHMAKKEPWLSLPMPQLSQEVDRLFDELIHRRWGGSSVASTVAWNPELDLYETDTAFVVEVDLPGVHEQDVSVVVEEGNLVLRGQRAFEEVRSGRNFYRRERHEGQFVRRLQLPASADQERIRAEFHDGVLRVTLPKLTQERKAQR
jgi:HSP20 family protein